MITVVTLGNPGDRYRHTPHNAGWIIADKVVPNDAWRFEKYAQADVAEVDGVLWVKPKTYMNNSGEVVPFLKKQYGATSGSLCVLHDDLYLPYGTLKISHSRGDGGHNGVKSIARHFGSNLFGRLRVGIEQDETDAMPADRYVLSQLSPSRLAEIHDLVPHVKKVITTIAESGFEAAMNKYNEGKPQ